MKNTLTITRQLCANIYKGIVENFYKHFDTPIVIDKHRGHPRNVNPLKMFVLPNPKIICTVRPIPDVIASYIKLIETNKQDDNFVDNDLRKKNMHINTANRAKVLWENYISDPYQSMLFGLENHRDNLHIVEYDQLVANPNQELEKIYSFSWCFLLR